MRSDQHSSQSRVVVRHFPLFSNSQEIVMHSCRTKRFGQITGEAGLAMLVVIFCAFIVYAAITPEQRRRILEIVVPGIGMVAAGWITYFLIGWIIQAKYQRSWILSKIIGARVLSIVAPLLALALVSSIALGVWYYLFTEITDMAKVVTIGSPLVGILITLRSPQWYRTA